MGCVRGLALAALVAASVLSGCGAHAVDDAPSLDEVAAATRADPYRFELSLKGEGLEDSFTATASGAADPAADRGAIRYTFVEDGGTTSLEVRRIGDEAYTRFNAPGFPGGGWDKESTAESDDAVGAFMFSEPHHAADALARHGRDVETRPEPLDGVATTYYRATVATIDILGAGLTAGQREEFAAEIRESGSETAEVEAWAGPDGVLRKLKLSIPFREDGEEGRLLTEARFFDFGAPVEIEAPPASEIGTSVTELGKSAPCRAETAPHSAEDVIAALRDADFTVSASCVDEETTIFAFAFADDGDDGDDGVYCFVAADARVRQEAKDAIVAGNVSCVAQTDASRKLVQRLLRGL